MRLIDQSVEVLYPRTLEEGTDELKRIETAGRNCWRSEGRITDESYRTFIANLLKRGHESPLEFGHIMLKLVTSRDVLAEITRHRLASFAVASQRYVNEAREEGGVAFIRPLFWKPFNPAYDYHDKQDKVYEASLKWYDAMLLAEDAYNRLIDLGMRNEDARKVLPNSTATVIMMDVNLRELLHIYNLRSSSAAYPEMRELMRLLKMEVDQVLPGFLPGDKEEK